MVETAHREGVTLLYPVPMMVTEEQMHLIDNGGDDSVRRDLPDTLITVRMKGDDPKRAKDHLTRGRRVAIAPWGLIERGQSLADWAREAGASARDRSAGPSASTTGTARRWCRRPGTGRAD